MLLGLVINIFFFKKTTACEANANFVEYSTCSHIDASILPSNKHVWLISKNCAVLSVQQWCSI